MLKPTFDSLPHEIVWQILIRIPAQDLFNATMFVCRSWYEIINTHDFRYAHLRRSTPGHLIKSLQENPVLYMTSPRDNIIALFHHGYNFPDYCFWSSCNGLILGSTHGDENTPLVIKNPVTKQRVTLPPFFPLITTAESPTQTSAIAYSATSKEYKVVATSCVDAERRNYARFCAVLTVGVDAEWRLLDPRHLSLAGGEVLSWGPFVTEGFVHWAHLSGTCIVSVNVETETITEVRIPWYYHPRGIIENYYFPVGGGSSLVCVLIGLDYYKWEVWEMKPETGEWRKIMPGIDLVAQRSAINRYFSKRVGSISFAGFDWRPFPVCWLRYGELIFFAFSNPEPSGRFRAAYNLRTGDIRCYDMGDFHEYPYLLHTNTLIRI